MRLFARFWPFGWPQSNPPAVGPQFHPLESNRNPSKMYSMFGGSFSQFSVFQLFPFSPLYLMICGAYISLISAIKTKSQEFYSSLSLTISVVFSCVFYISNGDMLIKILLHQLFVICGFSQMLLTEDLMVYTL